MKTIRVLLTCLALACCQLLLVGCDGEDGHSDNHRSYNQSCGCWSDADGNYYQDEYGDYPYNPPIETWNEYTGNYDGGSYDQPPPVVMTESYVTMYNRWSQPVTFNANGATYTVEPGFYATHPYTGSVTVTAPGFSMSWPADGNHSVTAIPGQVPSLPDYSSG